ncbi:MAG TPA: S46 family peptidase [Gemmataceae bacterium]|nr:S46 family peptidase [Gemmataceae bacterium]
MKLLLLFLLTATALLLAAAPVVYGDEGMWLFNNPPRDYLKKKYDFDATADWLEHVQKSSVRFNSGGSGSFVSPDGLVMTNHHVGADCLQKFGSKEHNYLRDGFHARTRADERKCDDLELNVLMSIEDVTERVKAAVKPDMKPEQAFAARRAVMAEIEKESTDKTGLRSDVITLYQGGQYHLYRFKKYTDVRLVFAPEQQIAFFGGDPDNFEYPRYDLDMCFFRVYENNKPAKIDHYLKWSKAGAKEGELVFVSGHPGRTDRLATLAELDYLRDTGFPFLLQRLNRWEVLLMAFSARSEENARQAKEFLFGVQNSRKARLGGLAALLDPQLMARKKEQEKKFRAKAREDESLKDARGVWDRIAQAQKVRAENIRKYTLLEGGAGFNSELFVIARTLLRAAEEKAKSNSKRLREFRESNLESLELKLFSKAPLYNNYEKVKLTDGLTFLANELGAEHPLVKKVLAGKSPSDRAYELVSGTNIKEVAFRKQLYKGGKEALATAKDPMIELARLADPEARKVRKTMESEFEEVQRQAYAQIAKVKFALEGTNTYPDATFTLRLAFGQVKGYEEQDGKHVPFETTFAGMYKHSAEHHNREPFDLPKRWLDKKDKLNLKTPLNFICTADIIGGNSGSPVINRQAEVVGLIFDGNIQSLALDFAYSDEQARATSVHSAGIVEALRKVYDADELADELTGKNR